MITAGRVYTLGLEVGPTAVGWARAVRGEDGIEIAAAGEAPATVGLDPHGTLTAMPAAGDLSLTAVTGGFVDLLGTSEAVMVGATPYGPEALLACVLASVRTANETEAGSAATAITLLRGSHVDEYHADLLLEATRLAGFPPDDVGVAWVDDAISSAGRGPIPPAEAAAIEAWAHVSDDPETSPTSGVGLAAGAGAGAGTLAGAGAAGLGAAGVSPVVEDAVGAGVAKGPGAGGVPGPEGAVAGPPGSTAGPDGSTIGPDGAAAPGPSGSSAPGPVGGVEGSGRPAWLRAAVVGVVAALAILVLVFVLLPPPESEEGETASIVATSVGPVSSESETAASAPASAAAATTEPIVEASTSQAPADVGSSVDLASFVGDWQQECSSESGTFYSVRYTVTQTGADQLTENTSAGIHQTSDCSDAPTLPTEEVLVWTVVGETVVDGLPTLQLTSDKGVNIRAIDGDTVYTAWAAPGSDFPTAFDPALESNRM